MNRLNAKVTLMGSVSPPLVVSKLSAPFIFPFFVFVLNCCDAVSDKPTENKKRDSCLEMKWNSCTFSLWNGYLCKI